MPDLNETTTITMTVKQAICSVASVIVIVLGGVWLIATYTMDGIKADVASIKTAITQVRAGNEETRKGVHSTETDLRGELAELTAQLRVTTASLSGLDDSVSGLDGSIQKVDEKLTASIFRQQDFERWVITRLGAPGSQASAMQLKWQDGQDEVISILQKGDNPLIDWYKGTMYKR